MDYFVFMMLGAIATVIILAWLQKRREEAPAQRQRTVGSKSGGAVDGDPLAQVQKLLPGLESAIEELAQPAQARDLPAFQRAVELLCSEDVPVEAVTGYATGANWVGSCVGAEALRLRDDGGMGAQAVLEFVAHAGPWPIVFLLNCLEARFDGPALGAVIARARPWWHQNPALIQAFTEAAARQGAAAGFGGALARMDDEEAVASLLGRLNGPAFAALKADFARWRAARVDEDFLRSVGTLTRPDPNAAHLRSARLDAYLQQMTDAQGDGAPRSLLLVGEPGVGREVLARRFAADMSREGWQFLELSVANVIAGKKFVGEIEEQIKRLAENANVAKRILLYVREFNELVSAGVYRGKPEGLLDSLLPEMEKSRMLIVGCLSGDAYQRLTKRFARLALAAEAIRVEPAGDDETQRFAIDYLLAAGACSEEAASDMAAETLQLARQYLSTPKAPASVLKLLELALTARQESRGQGGALTREDVLASLSRLSGLPMDVLDERQSLSVEALTAAFEAKVIGQREAVRCLVERIAMLKAGLIDSSRPIGVFLFAGPTGTGKTEIAKVLADLLFGDRERMVRLDMSEFQRSESLEKILGGQGSALPDQSLVAKIRQQPFSVVLLDEFEKANNRVWDLFLQVFDDGRLSDAAGNTVDFRHTIIILTSNLGATIDERPGLGFVSAGERFSSTDVMQAVTRTFRKEFLNRLDRVVVFNPLSREVMRRILNKELRLALERRGFRHREWAVEWEDTAVSFLLDKGFTVDMGARPLRRAIERHFLAPLSVTIVENRFPEGDQFLFVRSDGESLQVAFVDPDEEVEAAEPSRPATGELSLRAIVLNPSRDERERAWLLERTEHLAAQLDNEAWAAHKDALLEQINDPAIWQDERRHAVLDRYERIDRIESAAAAIARLARRVSASRPSRRLNQELAHKLYLVGTAIDDLDADRPSHAWLRVETGSADSPGAGRRAYAMLRDMYLAWAKRRGMRHKILGDAGGADGSRFTLAVSGFGAYSLLVPERGLHTFEFPLDEETKGQRANLIVRVVPQAVTPVSELDRFTAKADRAFADETDGAPVVVRRYQCLASPLVRDKVRGWRTGRLDLVLAGQFDLLA